jgi:hypothetical protein
MGVIKRQPSDVFFKELMSFVQQGCSMPSIVNIICPTHFLHLPNMSVFFSSTNVICLTLLMSFCQHFLCVVALVNIQCMTLDLHVLSQNKFYMFKLCFNLLLQYVAKLLLVIFYSYIQLCYQEQI